MANVGSRVTEIYKTLTELTDVVSTGGLNSLMVRGPGGLGKTHVVRERLKEKEVPYVLLQGYSAPGAMFNFLYEHRTELIVIDDCDSVFKDNVGLNILKAVLDTYPVRQVSWLTSSAQIAVNHFEFTGRVIFMTNLPLDKLSSHMSALLTRLMVFPLILTAEEVLWKIKMLALRVDFKDADKKDRYKVYAFLKDKAAEIPGLNLRHYVKCMDLLLAGTNWRKLFMECK